MKKVLAFILATLMILTLAACGTKTTGEGDGTNTDASQGDSYIPSVEKVSEGKPLFVSITNAKGSVVATVSNDDNHKKVEDTISGNKITNKHDKLFLNHIAYVTVEDRWTATYNCDNIGKNASITFTPKDNSANLMNITCKFEDADIAYGGASYKTATFAQDGTLTVKGATGKLSFSAGINTEKSSGDLDIRGNITKEGDITIKKISNTEFKVTSTVDITSLNVNYMNNDMMTSGEETPMLDAMAEKTAKEFTITIGADKVTIK